MLEEISLSLALAVNTTWHPQELCRPLDHPPPQSGEELMLNYFTHKEVKPCLQLLLLRPGKLQTLLRSFFPMMGSSQPLYFLHLPLSSLHQLGKSHCPGECEYSLGFYFLPSMLLRKLMRTEKKFCFPNVQLLFLANDFLSQSYY